MNNMNFGLALAGFVDALQARINAEFAERYQNLQPHKLSTDVGSAYIRIVETREGGSRSVHCFVRKADGAILKSAGWKAPFISKVGCQMRKAGQLPTDAATVRGNIFATDNGMSAVGTYGANYIR